jgi:putative transposase
MNERGVEVDHSTLQRWVEAFIPLIEAQVKRRKKTVNGSWRMDETYIKVKGEWCYLYRAVDKENNTIDFLLCKNRDTEAAKCFFKEAIENNGVPLKINIDKSGANTAALEEINQERKTAEEEPIEVRRIKYLNNQVEQEHRFIKRLTRLMAWFQIIHLCWYYTDWN